MSTFTIQPATPETLSDLYVLNADTAGAARLMDTFRARLERAEAHLSSTLLLRTPRGVEGTVMFGPAPHPYVFPHLRSDTPAEAVTAFLLALRHALVGMPERQIVLDTSRADVPAGPVLEAGWLLDDHRAYYETELAPGKFPLDPHAREGGAGWLSRADIRELLTVLGRADLDLTNGYLAGWMLVALPASADDETVVALGAYGLAKPGYGGVDMIGVQPEMRGLNLGTRLHRHLLARLAEVHPRHGGLVSADNHAMCRIFEKNGSVHVGTQRYFRQP